jgi:hypothetical protein
MNWAALKALTEVHVHRKDLPLDDAQSIMWRQVASDLDVIENEVFATIPVVAQPAISSTIWMAPLPADFGRLKLSKQGAAYLVPTDLKTLLQPQFMGCYYAVSGVGIYTRVNAPMLINYGLVPADLADAESNLLLTKYPNVVLYGLLNACSSIVQDLEAGGDYAGKYAQAIESANANSSLARTPAGWGTVNVQGGW